METKPVINVVLVRCQPALQERFKKWLIETHIPLLFKFKGIRRVSVYEKIRVAEDMTHEYLVIFEFESQRAFEEYETSPELAAAVSERRELWDEKGLGFEKPWREQYRPIESWERQLSGGNSPWNKEKITPP
jgi:antibiotic biosynthesis monooxygenase (ABM) superfamily enzyme